MSNQQQTNQIIGQTVQIQVKDGRQLVGEVQGIDAATRALYVIDNLDKQIKSVAYDNIVVIAPVSQTPVISSRGYNGAGLEPGQAGGGQFNGDLFGLAAFFSSSNEPTGSGTGYKPGEFTASRNPGYVTLSPTNF